MGVQAQEPQAGTNGVSLDDAVDTHAFVAVVDVLRFHCMLAACTLLWIYPLTRQYEYIS